MKTEKTNAKSNPKSNWFKLISIILIAYIFFQEDNRLHINIDLTKIQPLLESITLSRGDVQSEGKTENSKFALQVINTPKKISLSKELEKVEKEIAIAYLKRFSDVAVNERRKYGIPSSIILANALLNSTAGSRNYTLEGNNHFGLTCAGDWRGKEINSNGRCYRHYENSWKSFRDFSLFITTGKFKSLRKLKAKDYKGWAHSMGELGFYADENYSEHIIKIIEQYKLYELDGF